MISAITCNGVEFALRVKFAAVGKTTSDWLYFEADKGTGQLCTVELSFMAEQLHKLLLQGPDTEFHNNFH